MKAVRHRRFGGPDVLEICEMPVPAPGPNDVRVKIYATTVTAAETGMRQGRPLWGRIILGLFGPRKAMQVQGLEYAGVVDAVGTEVTRFEPGQAVFGFAGFRPGACAEYMCVAADGSIAPMPRNLDFDEAAAVVDGATTALFFLKHVARLEPAQRVVVVGASGSVGGYAVQLAALMGAEVTGVCSGANADFVRTLGAVRVIDYTSTDFTRGDDRYDVIFDAVGRSSFSRARRVLAKGGTYTSTAALARGIGWSVLTPSRRTRHVRTGMSVDKRESLAYISELVEQGRLTIPIDSTFELDQIREAHRVVDSGRKRGNVVIRVVPAN
jgi:NADPH2:quinone reductase